MFRALDSLAGMHAKFWDDERLDQFDLMDREMVIQSLSYKEAVASRDIDNVLPEWIVGGWEKLGDGMLYEETIKVLFQMRDNPHILIDAVCKLPRTLCHGDYRAANLAIESSGLEIPNAFDGQLASFSLMTIDLAWLINHWDHLLPVPTSTDFYRARLEHYLDCRFSDIEWRKYLELGFLAETLKFIPFNATFSHIHPDLELRAKIQRDFSRYNEIILRGIEWL
jgi:aminoglycoside/choline kinase family phosphotransferase